MSISNEVKRLEEENAQLKRALAQILSAIQSAVPLINSVVAEPKPPEEHLVIPPEQPVRPLPPQESGDGSYRVDVSDMIPSQGRYQTREY